MKVLKAEQKLFFFIVLFIFGLVSTLFVHSRVDTITLFIFYFLSFLGYIGILVNFKKSLSSSLICVIIVGYLAATVSTPILSNDFFRFLWDGEVFWSGLNPYDYTPLEVTHMELFQWDMQLQALYAQIDPLSQQNYTCYPPINQFYFKLSTFFSDSIYHNMIQLKLYILLTIGIGLYFLVKLLKGFKLSPYHSLILYANPLFIIEGVGNLHFEGVMISFIIISLYVLTKFKPIMAGVWMAVAIQIKLTPLMLLPFFLRLLNWKKATIFYASIFIAFILMSSIELNFMNIFHFKESLELYFRVFEFNSFIYANYLDYGKWRYGFYPISVYGYRLGRIALFLILVIALYGDQFSWKTFFKRMTMGYFVYLMLSSTVHPWYVLPLLALSIFTRYYFAIVWSGLIFTSYVLYNNALEIHSNTIIYLSYGLMLIVFILDVFYSKKMKTILQKWISPDSFLLERGHVHDLPKDDNLISA